MIMYSSMKRLYTKTHDKAVLEKAVTKRWITEDQMEQIIEEVDG